MRSIGNPYAGLKRHESVVPLNRAGRPVDLEWRITGRAGRTHTWDVDAWLRS